MSIWIPSLVTSSIVVITTVDSLILSRRIQLAKLEAKFEAVEQDIKPVEDEIRNLSQRMEDTLKDTLRLLNTQKSRLYPIREQPAFL